MCEFCERNDIITLIESSKKVNESFCYATELKASEMVDLDNSVIFENRNGLGFIRLVNREDCNCIEHGKYFEIKFCPMCGKRLRDD